MVDAFAGTKNTGPHFAAGKNIDVYRALTASETLDPDNVGKLVLASHASVAIVITCPRDTAADIPIGSRYRYRREGVAAVTLAAGSGATLNSRAGGGVAVRTKGEIVITKTAADTFEVTGDLEPAAASAAATAGAATLSALAGKITSEALTTAQDALYTLTITDDLIAAADIVLVSVANGTNTQGTTVVKSVTPGAGSVVVVIANKHATAQALNGTIVVSFLVVKQT